MKVSVKDSGCGIKPQDRDKLFKLFGTIESTRKKVNTKGIGLGLVISKMIVEQFDGKIDFTSKVGEGSDFFFTFKFEDYHLEGPPEPEPKERKEGNESDSDDESAEAQDEVMSLNEMEFLDD